jgi:hypothetical protein
MDNKINELKKNLPKESCSFCTHLSLDGPDENLKYNVKYSTVYLNVMIIANTLNQNIVV